jgi:hypothetical protein
LTVDQNDQTTATSTVKDIAKLLIQQRELYRMLGRLSERQRGFITGNEPERLLALLAERQRLIERLTAIQRRLKPYQADWRRIREGMGGDEGRQIDALVGEVDGLLAEILRKDEADTALLSARKQETGRAIGVVQAGRSAGAAYAAAARSGQAGMDWADA